MSRHRRHIIHPAPESETPGDQLVAKDPLVISSVADAQNVLASVGRATFFGDEHGYKQGHDALTALMPTLAYNNFQVLALELPVELNGFLKTLQHDISAQKLSVPEIAKRLNGAMDKLIQNVDIDKLLALFQGADRKALGEVLKKITAETGGDQRVLDWAKMIKAATENGIQIAGIDPRGNPEFIAKELKQFIEFQKKGGSFLDVANLERSLDAAAAGNLKAIIDKLPPGARAAVMYGAAHGCLGLNSGGLVQYLTQARVDVSNISLTSPASGKQEPGICPVGTHTTVDAPGLLHDVHKRHKPPVPHFGHQ